VRDGPMERVSWALVGNAGLLWGLGRGIFFGVWALPSSNGTRGWRRHGWAGDGVGARSYGVWLVFCFFQVSTIIFGHKIGPGDDWHRLIENRPCSSARSMDRRLRCAKRRLMQ